MLYDRPELEARIARANANHPEYIRKAAQGVSTWLRNYPQEWRRFGPWWPKVQEILLKYHPNLPIQHWNHGDEAPDYLERYDYGDELLNWFAAISTLHQFGEYAISADAPHSIEMFDGSRQLYVPGVGIIDVSEPRTETT